MQWKGKGREERPRSFHGKGIWVLSAIGCMLLQYGFAALEIANDLMPAGVTLIILASVCGPFFLWRCWKD